MSRENNFWHNDLLFLHPTGTSPDERVLKIKNMYYFRYNAY